jgi:AhpD family alkylhydroperoxidase
METNTRQQVYQESTELFGIVPEWVKQMPDGVVQGFWTLMKDFYLAETKVPNKYKDLIGIAVAGATRCRYCALFHTELAKLNGASDLEISEASAVSGLTMMGSTFLNAQQVDYDQFRKETLAIVEFVKSHPPPQKAPGVIPQAHA